MSKEVDRSWNSLLAEMDEASLSRLLRLLPVDAITVTKAPETGLLMMTARDSFDTDFCLGEILVTVAETRIGDAKGYAMILGDDPRRAMISASLDAIFRTGDEKMKTKLLRCLHAFKKRLRSQQRCKALLPSTTRVHFETMPEG